MSKKAFSVNQKFRVVNEETSFFATKKQILSGVGEHSDFNEAVRRVFECYESCHITDPKVTGFMSRSNGFTIQLDPR